MKDRENLKQYSSILRAMALSRAKEERAMAWSRAKGELDAMSETFIDDREKFERFECLLKHFVGEVENYELHR